MKSKKVIGLVFVRKKEELKYKRYVGVEAWVEAGRPEPAFIYDHPGALVDSGITIGDAVYRFGVYHRTEAVAHHVTSGKITPPGPASKTVKAFSARGGFEFPHEITVVEPEASKKAGGDGSKMSRGINKRKANKGSKNETDQDLSAGNDE